MRIYNNVCSWDSNTEFPSDVEFPLIISKCNGVGFKDSKNISKIKEGTANDRNLFYIFCKFIYLFYTT